MLFIEYSEPAIDRVRKFLVGEFRSHEEWSNHVANTPGARIERVREISDPCTRDASDDLYRCFEHDLDIAVKRVLKALLEANETPTNGRAIEVVEAKLQACKSSLKAQRKSNEFLRKRINTLHKQLLQCTNDNEALMDSLRKEQAKCKEYRKVALLWCWK